MEEPNLPDWSQKWARHSKEIFDGLVYNGYSDATICCDGKRISVHKTILVSASDFFRDILNTSTASHPIIIMENVDLEVLEALLMFIYRGEVILHSSETPALFKLAKEFKIKGLVGTIGSDSNLLYDSKPLGMDIVNLNVFRKYINPCQEQSNIQLCFQINQLLCAQKIYENRRRNRLESSSSPSADQAKTKVVKDKKYKSVVRNRSSVYEKEIAINSLAEDNEEEICNQLCKISLVKNTSATFSEEAVKDLVTRLNSNLSMQEQEEANQEEQGIPSSGKASGSSHEQGLPYSGEASDSSQEQQEEPNLESLKSKFSVPDFLKAENLYPETLPITISLPVGEKLKSTPGKQRVCYGSSIMRCKECPFETTRKGTFNYHVKFHCYEKDKHKYSPSKQAFLKEYFRRKSCFPMKKVADKCNKCGKCGIEFDSEDRLVTHLTSHFSGFSNLEAGSSSSSGCSERVRFLKKRGYMCFVCSCRSYDLESMNAHMKTHGVARSHLSCDIWFNKSPKLCIYKEMFGQKILRCSQCPFRSMSSKVFLLHFLKKHRDAWNQERNRNFRDMERLNFLFGHRPGNLVNKNRLNNLLDTNQSGNLSDTNQSDNVLDTNQSDNVLDTNQSDNVLDTNQSDNLLDTNQSDNVLDTNQSDNLLNTNQSDINQSNYLLDVNQSDNWEGINLSEYMLDMNHLDNWLDTNHGKSDSISNTNRSDN